MLTTLVGLACLAAGFGGGWLKYSGKLKAIEAEVKAVENNIVVDGKALVADIKKHL
jgi:hypothetical protein